jgi:hypothetical protein
MRAWSCSSTSQRVARTCTGANSRLVKGRLSGAAHRRWRFVPGCPTALVHGLEAANPPRQPVPPGLGVGCARTSSHPGFA